MDTDRLFQFLNNEHLYGSDGIANENEEAQGFPGGAVVQSPPADAEDAGSCPSPGRSHIPRSGWAHEPWPLSLRVRSRRSTAREATAVRCPRTAKTKTKTKRTQDLNSHGGIND